MIEVRDAPRTGITGFFIGVCWMQIFLKGDVTSLELHTCTQSLCRTVGYS